MLLALKWYEIKEDSDLESPATGWQKSSMSLKYYDNHHIFNCRYKHSFYSE